MLFVRLELLVVLLKDAFRRVNVPVEVGLAVEGLVGDLLAVGKNHDLTDLLMRIQGLKLVAFEHLFR